MEHSPGTHRLTVLTNWTNCSVPVDEVIQGSFNQAFILTMKNHAVALMEKLSANGYYIQQNYFQVFGNLS